MKPYQSYAAVPTSEDKVNVEEAFDVDTEARGSGRRVSSVLKSALGHPLPFAFVATTLLTVALLQYKSGAVHTAVSPSSISTKVAAVSEFTSSCLKPSSGPVLAGYDLVAYFSLEAGSDGVRGSEEYMHSLGSSPNAYTFYFASDENRALFAADPAAYLPQWGGFCAWGIAEEDWWTVDTLGPDANPNVWEIVNGKLYFFMYNTPKENFLSTEDGKGLTQHIADGDKKWRAWFEGASAYNTDCYWWNAYTD